METNFVPGQEVTGLKDKDVSLEESAQTWPLHRVGLRVQDIAACVDYYTQLGFTIIRDERDQQGGGSVGLGVGAQEILSLRAFPGGHPRPRHTAGLYHFALLVGDEVELGSFLKYRIDRHLPIDGASDHLVSQALYLNDPEGNGIEVYADRPRETWQFSNGQLNMGTLPLNAPALLQKAQPFNGFSTRLRLGHMHLNVGNLERSMAFYQPLGMNLMVGMAGQADFLSWDGYHHHLGINLWAGRNVPPVEPDVYGIDFYEIKREGLAPATMQDPDGVTVIVR
ncbi:MAG TPA: VOC family protein [Ktedonobacteraceae bacterium]|nr:VOC family protein [Ktedonobacteraceae bacterium]